MSTTTTTRRHITPAWREQKVEALRDGRKNRAATFKARKGKGSYTRKGKHGDWR